MQIGCEACLHFYCKKANVCHATLGPGPKLHALTPVSIQKLIKSIDEIKRPFAFKE